MVFYRQYLSIPTEKSIDIVYTDKVIMYIFAGNKD